MPLKPAPIACAKPGEAADIGHGAAVATIVQNIGHVGLALWEALPLRVAIVRAARVTVHLASVDAQASLADRTATRRSPNASFRRGEHDLSM
mgnify:CR=1 FL=1